MTPIANMYLQSNYEKFYAKIATKFDEIGFRTIANFAYYETAEELTKDLQGASNLVTSIAYIVDFEDGYILSKDKNDSYAVYHPFEYQKVLMFDTLNQNLLSAVMREAILSFDNLTPAVSTTMFPAEIEEIYQELKTNLNAVATLQLDGYYVVDTDGKKIGKVAFNKFLFIDWYNNDNNVSYQDVTYDFNFQLELNKILLEKNYNYNSNN